MGLGGSSVKKCRNEWMSDGFAILLKMYLKDTLIQADSRTDRQTDAGQMAANRLSCNLNSILHKYKQQMEMRAKIH